MENKIWTKDQIELQQILYFLLLAPSPPRPPLFKTRGGGGWAINDYPLDSAIGFPNTYPLDSDLSSG